MKLSESHKKIILEKYNSIENNDKDFSETVEIVTDYLLDENIIDISEDEDGDAHEDLLNSVWEFLELECF